MSKTVHVFSFLASPAKVAPVTVCYGDEPFLKRLARTQIVRQVLGADAETPFATLEGDAVQWRDVTDELFTVSLFGGGPRLVVVETADGFVTSNRDRLENLVAKPKSSGVLLLEVGTWPRNTRLFKSLDKSGLQVECRAPEQSGKRKALDELAIKKWLIARATNPHQFRLEPEAADVLFDLVGPEFGLLEQATAKLALFADESGAITPQQVNEIVGGWRATTIWELIDAAVDGHTDDALRQLDRLLQSGEHPLALFGQMAWSLRRFASATRIFEESERSGRRCRLSEALVQAGFPHWNRRALDNAERQLKRLGRQRAGRLYGWLLETDLALKGSHSSPQRARLALEKLFLTLAAPPPKMAP